SGGGAAHPAAPGMLPSRVEGFGRAGTAGRLAGRLRGLAAVRFDVVEGPSPGCDPERYSFEPTLGLFRASIGADGGIVVGEGPLRALLDRERGQALTQGLQRLLGTAWDEALEPLRRGGDGAPVTLLSRTG
ncbi:MAG: DUF3145 family protein, partial [Frankiaceae bacterium]